MRAPVLPSGVRPRTAAVAVVLGIAVAVPVARFVWSVSGGSLRLQQAFADDTYYYALIAQHLAHGQGSTFGGRVPTNGYQPLWQMTMVPLAALADGDGFLRLLLGLVAVLFAASVVLMGLIAHRLRAVVAGVYAILYAVTVGLLVGNQFFDGMEIALVLPALLAFLGVAITRPPGVRTGVVLGLLALVVALGRLDALAIPVLYGALALLRRDRRSRTTMLTAGALLAAGLAAYALVGLVLFGTALPVSGQAKALGGGSLGATLLVDYLTYGGIGPLPVLLGAQTVLLTAVALVLLARTTVFGGPADGRVRTALVACLLGQAAQIAYFTITSSFEFWPWYYYAVPVQLFLAVLVIAQVAVRSRWGRRAASAPVVVAAVVAALVVNLGAFLAEPPESDSYTAAAVPTAAWLRAHSAPDDVVAMGDRAGYFAWLVRRPFVQLEGLVEDASYLAVLRERRIAEHMESAGVRFYVRSEEIDGPAPPVPTGCTALVEPLQGTGPKSLVPVCAEDLVHHRVGGDYSWSIWEFRR